MVDAAERNYDGPQLQARIKRHWQQTDAYHQTKRARSHGKAWYFLDGPPYATGSIHIGTSRNKVLKDAYIRHMRMRGFNVRDQPGYDMHGLPIEVKVEKELGFDSKRDIEAYGIDKFVDACRHFATQHLKTMNEDFRDLGVWMDWDHPYMTLTNDYIEGAWWAIEKAHERGLLSESERVLSWCWRCQTPLANAEVEFEDREDPSVYVRFPLTDRPGESLLIWTTTPWTLPANVAIAVHPDLTYARIRVGREGRTETLIVAADLAEAVAKVGRYETMEVLGTVIGAELEGLRYQHPFAQEVAHHRTNASEWNNRVILGEHVAADRTGLVHTATGHGVEDYEVGKKYGIAVFSPVGEDGRYTEAAGPLAGLQVKTATGTSPADERVLQLLRERTLLVSSRNEKHAYGHCWRCKNPIVFRATSQWFIEVPKIKDRMISETKRVHWTPEWAGSARQLDWVEGARDWCISRQRYWGIPLPVWKCAHCGEKEVVGSRTRLRQISNYHDGDLHRPWIDKVRVACPRRGCGGHMKRVPDVLDVWFDSAVASWASLGYPSHKHDHDRLFPVKWIVEGLDQTRGWFYSQLAAGVAAMDQVPYERVVMHGWVNDITGRAMSKSSGAMGPREVIAKYGADPLRLALLGGAAPWEDITFSEEAVRSAQRTLNILWNVHVFATQYMAEDKYDGKPAPERHLQPEDKWLVSRLQTTVAETTRWFEGYEFHRAQREVERFVLEDLSRWYVRLVRERVWDEADADTKRAAYGVLHEALSTTARLLAPFAPFTAEAIHRDLTGGHGKPSVHMEDWPVADGARTDYDLERDMGAIRAIVDAAAYARQKANMKLRWPVAKIVVATDDGDVRAAIARFRATLLEQANAKDVEIVGADWEKLDLAILPNKAAIGKGLRERGPALLRALANMPSSAVRDVRARLSHGGVAIATETGEIPLSPDMVSGFETRLPADTTGADFPGGSVYVETTVDAALQAEGASRDVVRRIQEMRKQMGLAMGDTVATQIHAPADFVAILRPHAKDVAEATRSASLDFVDAPTGALVKTWELEDVSLTIGLRAGHTTPKATAPTPAKPPATKPQAATPRGAKAPAKAAKKPAKKAKKKTASQPAPKRSAKAPARKPTAKKSPTKKIAAKKAAKKAGAKKSAKASSKKSKRR